MLILAYYLLLSSDHQLASTSTSTSTSSTKRLYRSGSKLMNNVRKYLTAFCNNTCTLFIEADCACLLFIAVLSVSSLSHGVAGSVETVQRNAFTMVTPRIYPKEIVVNKLREQFDSLGDELQLSMFYRPVSRQEELAGLLIGDEIDLIIWGFIPELDERLTQAGFSLLLTAKLEVDLYTREGLARQAVAPGITIGGLAYTAATRIALAYYKKLGIAVNVETFTNYFEAMKELNAGNIDYIVAAPTFYRQMKKDIKRRYKRVHNIETTRKIHVYLRRGNRLPGETERVANYFIKNIDNYGLFSRVIE